MSVSGGFWPQSWSAEVLERSPLIAPARQFTYPMQVAGEEDALSRGALRLMVRPAAGGNFLAICALGFVDRTMPTGVFACPNPDEMCAVAGGYAYVLDTMRPEKTTHIPLKPVVQVRGLVDHDLLLFVGFHGILAWGRTGTAWKTDRLSWEGVRLAEVEDNVLRGTGWDLMTDKDVPFTVNLLTGTHQGGGYSPGRRE